MLTGVKRWLALKARRALGFDEVLSGQGRIVALIGGGETRQAALLDRIGAGLTDEMRDASARIDSGLETLRSELAAWSAARGDPAPDPRLELLTLTDSAVLGLQRTRLKDRHGALDIETDHPVAYQSPDHLVPWGTKQDNSRQQRFNARLIGLVPNERLSLLDLGCSGGGLVRSMIEQGYLAAGVEGSDYSQRRLRAEWLTIPDFLFTADIAKPFRLVSDRAAGGIRFGVVTLWEVIEHIAESDLPLLFRNIDAHLRPGGLVVLSVSPNSDVIEGVELHQTIQQRPWWSAFFASIGWTDHPAIVEYFGDDLVRGGANAPNSFHFALSRAGEMPVLTARTRHLGTAIGDQAGGFRQIIQS